MSEQCDNVVFPEIHSFVCLDSRTHSTISLVHARQLGAVTGTGSIPGLSSIFLFYLRSASYLCVSSDKVPFLCTAVCIYIYTHI